MSSNSPSKKPVGPLTPSKAGKGNNLGQEGEIQFVEEDAVEVADDDDSTINKKSSFAAKHGLELTTSSHGCPGAGGTIPVDTSIESMPSSLGHCSHNGLDCEYSNNNN